jgi:hypothetical protein
MLVSQVQDYIELRQALFWSVGKNRKKVISEHLLVETILNYGTQEDVHELLSILGLKRTADIFFEATNGSERHNYFPQVENFFRLYFKRYAS